MKRFLLPVLCVGALCGGWRFVPGAKALRPSGDGSIPDVAAIEAGLKRHVGYLAGTVGERHAYRPGSLEQSGAYIENAFRELGYAPTRQTFRIGADKAFEAAAGREAFNIEARKASALPGAKTLVIGAHYDTRVGMDSWSAHGPVAKERTGTPGANDNASGVAALLELARLLSDIPLDVNLCFVAYANEEPPFFKTEAMGSLVHARSLVKELGREAIEGMVSLETLGCYSPRVTKKRARAVVPSWVGLVNRCDYIAFMATNRGGAFSRACADAFTRQCRFPVRAFVSPYYSRSVAWSDDWAYLKQRIPAFAVTDTAFLRCDDYHETSDTPEKLDYPQFAEVTDGLAKMIRARYESPYRLVWADEFDRDGSPDPAKWNYEQGYSRNKEMQWYQPQNAVCSNGFLWIEGRRETRPNPLYNPEKKGDWRAERENIEYTSACLTTQHRQAWTYGRFEVRAKIRTETGLWPAIWFLGTHREWPECGEIDLLEYYHHSILANVCWAKAGEPYAQSWRTTKRPMSHFGGDDWDQSFHTWRMDWSPAFIRLYLDDELLNEVPLSETLNPDGKGPKEPFRQPMFLLLNLAMGSTGGSLEETALPSYFIIDYVRVWQRGGENR